MHDGFYDTKNWLIARINLAFADVTTSSDPSYPDYQSMMMDNIEFARQWRADIEKDGEPSTLIEFVTDDDDLIQEAFEFLNANDPKAKMRTFNLIHPNKLLHYVVVRMRDEGKAALFKMFFSGRDLDGFI